MKVIVLTPVRNEDWILDQFLQICSLFADHIIIADQNSTDRSIEIASKFEKVVLIKNDNLNFNEAERQKILIAKARELYGLGNLLLALDADEIISADSINAAGWEIMKQAPLGTVFFFDKPTPLFQFSKALRYKDGFPLGFKDDDSEHQPTLIHSTRIPIPQHASKIVIHDILFLHLCFARPNIQFSKNRYYCILENINKSSGLRLRRLIYSYYSLKNYLNGEYEAINPLWFEAYDKLHINLKKFNEESYYYMDFEVLKLFQKWGTKRFFNEPIWKFDWEKCRLKAIDLKIEGIPTEQIKKPTLLRIYLVDITFAISNIITSLVRKIRK
ncbi:hypothetical protein RCH18_002533 [Flavobacterium sp. PL11]|jgi:hypothetical protein|uniref:glycosyltransferase family 2 protein n=1 Tax=Flavobacterium sp. PL11 TaxID=3071717 RepID=UPI002E08E692|nr:hypothetical protein [Flavobacterium sp. PL11]